MHVCFLVYIRLEDWREVGEIDRIREEDMPRCKFLSIHTLSVAERRKTSF